MAPRCGVTCHLPAHVGNFVMSVDFGAAILSRCADYPFYCTRRYTQAPWLHGSRFSVTGQMEMAWLRTSQELPDITKRLPKKKFCQPSA